MSLAACLQEPVEQASSTERASVSELKESPLEEVAAPYGYWVCPDAPPPACVFTWTGEGNALIRCNTMCRAAGSPSGNCHFSEEITCE